MDPNTATREQFTQNLLRADCPAGANATYKHLFENLQKMLKALAEHDGMSQNMQQTFMTPANSKNKVYFMWDFTGRTLGMLAMVPPSNPSSAGDMWTDCVSRSATSSMLILDTTGKLDSMCEPTADENVEFGPAVEEVAREMNARPGQQARAAA